MSASVKHCDPRQSIRSLLLGSAIDRMLLVAALAATIAAWFIVQALVTSGPAIAEIYHGNILLASYPLPKQGDEPIHLSVDGNLGPSEIVLDENGIRIADSPCSSRRCVYAGAHRHAGDMIACIPNRILITIRGSQASQFDAIVE